MKPYRARKVGGSYEADGTVVAEFKTLAGAARVVLEFDTPAGMLHIFRWDQVSRAMQTNARGAIDCPREGCAGTMVVGQAIGAPGVHVECLKCNVCGHSVTA